MRLLRHTEAGQLAICMKDCPSWEVIRVLIAMEKIASGLNKGEGPVAFMAPDDSS